MKQIGIKLLKTKKLRWEDVDNGESKYDIYYEPDREYLNGSFPSTPKDYDMWRIFIQLKGDIIHVLLEVLLIQVFSLLVIYKLQIKLNEYHQDLFYL